MTTDFNSKLDLTFERIVDVPPHLVWRAWTEPELIKEWFCPLPWKTIEAELDVRPGGIFRTTMQSPEGKEFPNIGCYLETVKNEKLVWTNALLPGFRPALMNAPCGDESAEFMFTAKVEMAPHGEPAPATAPPSFTQTRQGAGRTPPWALKEAGVWRLISWLLWSNGVFELRPVASIQLDDRPCAQYAVHHSVIPVRSRP